MPSTQTLAELFCQGKYVNDINDSTWRDAFLYMAEHVEPSKFNQAAVHTLWTVNGGHLRRKIQDDHLIACVLKKSLPGYQGNGLFLYRGECQFLYEKNKIGFCWSSKIDVAKKFARGLNAIESGGVLLRAFAPPEAILAEPNDHSTNQMEEFEYTCDPWKLEKITALMFYPKYPNP